MPALRILVLSEDGAEHAHDVVVALAKSMLKLVDEHVQTQRARLQFDEERGDGRSELVDDYTQVDATFHINEGIRYRIQEVVVQGAELLTDKQVAGILGAHREPEETEQKSREDEATHAQWPVEDQCGGSLRSLITP